MKRSKKSNSFARLSNFKKDIQNNFEDDKLRTFDLKIPKKISHFKAQRVPLLQYIQKALRDILY